MSIVGREVYGKNPRTVARKGVDEFASLHFVYFDVTIVRSRDEVFSIVGEGKRPNWHGMAFQGGGDVARFNVVQSDHSVDRTASNLFSVFSLDKKKTKSVNMKHYVTNQFVQLIGTW